MRGIVKKFTIIVGAITSTFALAQEVLQNGIKESLDSKILNEKREIFIHLPKSYSDSTLQPSKYPVVYLLDGETNFDYYSGMVDLLSKQPYAEIPEMIVVGIKNTDRTRDLTTSKSLEKSDKNPNELVYKSSGGSEAFYQFLEKEVKEVIKKKYRVNDYQLLVGHSYGGLFATDILFNHTSSFNAYVIHDPSLWWDNQKQMQQIRNYFNKGKKLSASTFVFLSQASDEGRSQKTIEEMTTNIVAFKDIMTQNHTHFKHQYYPNEGHGMVIYPANFDALRFIFKGYRTNVKDFALSPEKLMQSYQAFSEKQNYPFQPSESYINFIISYLKRTNNEKSMRYMEQLKTQIFQHRTL